MDVTKPYEFIWFGDIHGPKPYKFIGFRWAFISQTPVVRKAVAPIQQPKIGGQTCSHQQPLGSSGVQVDGHGFPVRTAAARILKP